MTNTTKIRKIKGYQTDLTDDNNVIRSLNSYMYDLIEDFKNLIDTKNSTGIEAKINDGYREDSQNADPLICEAVNHLDEEINRLECEDREAKERKRAEGRK